MAAAELKAPSEAQNASYRRCLQFDRLSFDERRAGRSGLLTPEQQAEHDAHWAIVADALDNGVGFDRAAFGDVEAA